MITDQEFTSLVLSFGIVIPKDIVSLIQSVQVHRLVPLLEAIIRLDCVYYSKIYNSLFGRLDFQALVGDDIRYLLVF